MLDHVHGMVSTRGLPAPEALTLYAAELLIVLRCVVGALADVDAWAIHLGASPPRLSADLLAGETSGWRRYETTCRVPGTDWRLLVYCDQPVPADQHQEPAPDRPALPVGWFTPYQAQAPEDAVTEVIRAVTA